jgi:hypothetical protein
MTADVVKLPTPDPIFALVPELKLHSSEIDGALVTNSREVARVFFRDNHRDLIGHIMWLIWNRSMRSNYHNEFRQRPDGTVDITPDGLLSATSHWGFEYEESERHREFTHAWIGLVSATMREIKAKTGINPMHQKMQELFGPLRCFKRVGDGDEVRECCQDCIQPVPAGPMLHDELWAAIAEPDAFLCFDCIEKRLGRRLTQGDLTVCPFNAGWVEFPGDVVAMQFACGRQLLPPMEQTK